MTDCTQGTLDVVREVLFLVLAGLGLIWPFWSLYASDSLERTAQAQAQTIQQLSRLVQAKHDSLQAYKQALVKQP